MGSVRGFVGVTVEITFIYAGAPYCWMHLKKNRVEKGGKLYEYAVIVQSVREGSRVTQKTLRNLGRMVTEEDWGWAESVLRAMKREEEVPEAEGLEIKGQCELGGVWAAEELWWSYGVRGAIVGSLDGRRTGFDLERVVFLLVVNRLYNPSSDLSAYRWIRDKAYTSIKVKRQWIYRSLDVLAEEKDRIEENLFNNLKESLDLSLDLVLYDLTSTYFEGIGPELAEYGYSRDHRPDRKQLVLGVVMAGGVPIAHRVWTGNTADKSTLKRAVADLRERFGIKKVVLVADRGVISLPNLEELEKNGYQYILSTKRRRHKLVEELLAREVPGTGKTRAREVRTTGDRRYVLCLDEETRRSRLEALKEGRRKTERELRELGERYEKTRNGKERGRPTTKKSARQRVGKILGTNKRLFDVTVGETIKWELNVKAWRYERAIAGKFLLVTTSDLEPSQAMESYKELKDVERAFDELKNLLKLRPIYHQTDKRVKGHVFICILALVLRRLMERKTGLTFREIMERLEKLRVNLVQFRGKRFQQRNQIDRDQEQVFKSLGVPKPPRILNVETTK